MAIPTRYFKAANGDVNKAHALYRADEGRKGASMATRKSSGGSSVARQTGPGAGDSAMVVKVGSHPVREHDRKEAAAILQGLVVGFRSMMKTDLDRSEFFDAPTTEEEVIDRKYQHEKRLGAFLASILGPVLAILGVTEAEWIAFFRFAMRDVRVKGGGSSSSWHSPFDVPTVVTSPFGAARAGRLHRGIDLRAPEGTPVHAPADGRVDDVYSDEDGGLTVRLALRRPDGGYAAEATTGDDSGFLVSFAHLQSADVAKGDVVQRGQVVAKSGNSGRSSGPHLHVAVEYFNDAPFWSTDSNSRVFVDPTGPYGHALTDPSKADPIEPGEVYSAQVVDRRSGAAQPNALVVNRDGTVVLGNGNTVVTTSLKSVIDLPLSGSGELSLARAPIPDALRGVASEVASRGGELLRGAGQLAGQLFTRENLGHAVRLLAIGGYATSAGAGALGGVAGLFSATPAAPVAALAAPTFGVFSAATGVLASVFDKAAERLSGQASPVLDTLRGLPGALGGVPDALRGLPDLLPPPRGGPTYPDNLRPRREGPRVRSDGVRLT